MIGLEGFFISLALFFVCSQVEGSKIYGPEITLSNIDEVWAQHIAGKGITVAVVDDGVNYKHRDLKDNYDSAVSYDFPGNDSFPMPESGMNHGTKCAGIIAARLSGTCRTGVAYKATLAGLKLFDGLSAKSRDKVAAFEHKRNQIDIYSNSWGPADNGYSIQGPTNEESEALEKGTKEGRNGLGSIFVFSSGNGGFFGDSCAFDGYVNNIHTIAIGGISKYGISRYAEPCSSVMAVAYGGSVKTCSGRGRTGCDDDFGRTSAAAAFASGIIALLLDSTDNKKLTWRDVQHLIVRTSNPKAANIDGNKWTRNGAGLMVHPAVGFGVLDAKKLVDVGKLWQKVPTQRICSIGVVDNLNQRTLKGSTHLTFSIKKTGKCASIRFIEHVQVEISLFFSPRAIMEMHVTSPQTTTSQLLYKRIFDALSPAKRYNGLVITSLHFWGENPIGEWKILFKPAESMRFLGRSGAVGALKKLNVTVYGTREDPLSKNSLPKGKKTCGGNTFWKGYGPLCCGSMWTYHKSSEKCCVDYKMEKVVGLQDPRCGSTTYNECNQICCNGVRHNKFDNYNAMMSCCGRRSYDKIKKICCRDRLYDDRLTCKWNSRKGGYYIEEKKCSSWGTRSVSTSKTCRGVIVPSRPVAVVAKVHSTKVFLANIIVDDKMNIYADGVLIGSNNQWNVAKTLNITLNTTVIAIEAVNYQGAHGIKASFDGARLVTDGKRWRCSATKTPSWAKISFDDSQWPLAKEIIYYGDTRRIRGKERINAAAKWIWTNSYEDHNVYCRAKIAKCEDKFHCVKDLDCADMNSRRDCAKTCGFCYNPGQKS